MGTELFCEVIYVLCGAAALAAVLQAGVKVDDPWPVRMLVCLLVLGGWPAFVVYLVVEEYLEGWRCEG